MQHVNIVKYNNMKWLDLAAVIVYRGMQTDLYWN